MVINTLTLSNFRAITELKLEFEKLNAIVGANASGKSTILEAINFLSSGKSIRAEHDIELIKTGKQTARIEGRITKDSDAYKLEVAIMRSEHDLGTSKKQLKVNGVSRNLANFSGNFYSVIFTPIDLELIIQGPQIRRKFLDTVLTQTSREYHHAHTNLVKTIRQRNKLLEKIRDQGKGWDELDFWNAQLITESKIIHKYRAEYFSFIKNRLETYGNTLNKEKGNLSATYKKSEVTTERLENYQSKEIASKSTLIGPQRDDFELFWQGLSLEAFGSRGQQRTGVLALKLCEIDYILEKTGFRPVLLLDDIFSELDDLHRKQIFDAALLQQTIVTTTDKSIISDWKNFTKIEI